MLECNDKPFFCKDIYYIEQGISVPVSLNHGMPQLLVARSQRGRERKAGQKAVALAPVDR